MRKDPLKKALQAVRDLRPQGPSDDAVVALLELVRKGPGLVVAKAAGLAAEWQAAELAPELESVFYRLGEDGRNVDPQCWGKVSIIKALFELAWQDADVYLQGCKTVQLEPVYGGKEDSAITVRTASIQILVQLPAVATTVVMSTLADLPCRRKCSGSHGGSAGECLLPNRDGAALVAFENPSW